MTNFDIIRAANLFHKNNRREESIFSRRFLYNYF